MEDSPMRDVDDEDEEETYVPPVQPSKEIVDRDRKARKEREDKLRQMMEEDDEDEVEAVEEPKVEEAEKEKSVEPEKEKSVVSGGRRRGRRRVMKKKTVKDAEGYLGMVPFLSSSIWATNDQ
jgi:DNA polymerase delta subunit 3